MEQGAREFLGDSIREEAWPGRMAAAWQAGPQLVFSASTRP